jgi:hypothetical protein
MRRHIMKSALATVLILSMTVYSAIGYADALSYIIYHILYI